MALDGNHTAGTSGHIADHNLIDAALTARLLKASNLGDVASVPTARTNLGLGTAATANTGTTSGTVPLLSTGGLVPPARLGGGTPSATTYLDGTGTWSTPAGSGGSGTPGAGTITEAMLTPALRQSMDAVIRWNGSGSHPLRSTATADAARRVRWAQPTQPLATTGYALSGDVWEKTP